MDDENRGTMTQQTSIRRRNWFHPLWYFSVATNTFQVMFVEEIHLWNPRPQKFLAPRKSSDEETMQNGFKPLKNLFRTLVKKCGTPTWGNPGTSGLTRILNRNSGTHAETHGETIGKSASFLGASHAEGRLLGHQWPWVVAVKPYPHA